jgi:glycosyltransferase involved in cell wall biosynthesis
MTDNDRSPTRVPWVGSPSSRARLVRAFRRSRAAAIVRGAAARSAALTSRLIAPDRGAQRLRNRTLLALQAARSRRRAIAGIEALGTEIAQLPEPPPTTSSISVVLLIDGSHTGIPLPDVRRQREVIAVLHGDNARAPSFATRVLPTLDGESLAAGAARGARQARGDRLCFALASSEHLGTGLLGRLNAALVGDTAAAAALVVHPVRARSRATPYDGRVRQCGFELAVDDSAPVLVARAAGELPKVSPQPIPIAGASAACLLVDRTAYETAGGLPDYADIDVAMFDLCRRVGTRGDAVVAVSGAIVLDHRPVPSAKSLTRPIPRNAPAWRDLVDDAGPALLREAAPLAGARIRIAITVAAPSRKVAPRWGDWHLARAFSEALLRAGHVVRLQTADAADDPAGRSCDVHCVVRGLAPVRRTRGQHHVLWIISHPEAIEVAELDAADLVLVASTRFAAELQTRTRTPVESLLQATDPVRFRPVSPESDHRHDVTVVAKSRDQYRTTVADAIASGLRPAIYGSGWEQFVDPALIVSDYVDNDDLARVYSSAGVVLNDHWDSMREWGFVSNRIFDALACGTPVISDELPEITELFDGAVPTFRDAAQLRTLVDEVLADPGAARTRARRGMDIVLAHHTFDQRAHEFLDALARHGLDAPPQVRHEQSES